MYRTLFYLLLAACAAKLPAQSAYWGQDYGGAARQAWIDVEPILREPEELLHLEVGTILAGPAVWGKHVFVAVAEEFDPGAPEKVVCVVLMLDLQTGEEAARYKLRKRGAVHFLAVHNSRLVAATPEYVALVQIEADGFKHVAAKSFDNIGVGLLLDQVLVLRESDRSAAIFDTKRLQELGAVDLPGDSLSWYGGRLYSIGKVARDESLGLQIADLNDELAKRKSVYPKVRSQGGRMDWPGFGKKDFVGRTLAIALGDRSLLEEDAVFDEVVLRIPAGVPTTDGGRAYSSSGRGFSLSPIRYHPVIYHTPGEDFSLVGFSASGSIFSSSIRQSGYRKLYDADDLPSGMRVGDASRVANIAYFPNAALDLKTGEILWVKDDLDGPGPLIPCADRRVLAVASDRRSLIVLGNPEEEVVACVIEGPQIPEGGVMAEPSRMGDGPGVILTNGQRVQGRIESHDDDRLVWLRNGDQSLELPRAWIISIENDGFFELIGREVNLLDAWLVFEGHWIRTSADPVFEEYRDAGMPREIAALVGELRAFEVDDDWLRSWEAAGQERVNTTGRGASWGKDARARESRFRNEWLMELDAVTNWAFEQGLENLATCLVNRRSLLAPEPGNPPVAWAEFKTIPHGISAESWAAWAGYLLEADAHFLMAKEGMEAADTWWIESPGVLLQTSSADPALVGPCVVQAERAIEALECFLALDRNPQSAPLQMRIFATEHEYQQHQRSVGSQVPTWSAGFYSPSEQRSYFYIPLPGQSVFSGRRGSRLQDVLVHELTHQFLSERWLKDAGAIWGDPRQPGYWVVEGFARFVEDQAASMRRGTLGMNRIRVGSLDVTAQLNEIAGGTFKLEHLLNLSRAGFARLRGEPYPEPIPLRHTSGVTQISQVGIFYDQSGALVYFLAHKKGDEGRRRLLEFMRNYYTNRSGAEGWRVLGYSSMDELEAEFRAFLKEVNLNW